jgi:hypothetical protein
MMRIGSLRYSIVGLLCLAVLVPAMAGAQSGEVQVSIDSPGTGAPITNGQPVEIRGWVVDTSSAQGTGIEAVEIALEAQAGTASQPIFAQYGLPRPDVAQAYGRQDWLNSGFTFTWTPEGLRDGSEYTIRVWGHSPGGVSRFSTVTLATLAPRPTTVVARNATPTPHILGPGGIRVIDERQRLACQIDITLIAPQSFARPCPGDPTATPDSRRR